MTTIISDICPCCGHDKSPPFPVVPSAFAGGELIRIQVKEGDKFFIMFKQELSMEAVKRIKEMWKQFIGDEGADIIVLTNGALLGVFNVDEAKGKGK